MSNVSMLSSLSSHSLVTQASNTTTSNTSSNLLNPHHQIRMGFGHVNHNNNNNNKQSNNITNQNKRLSTPSLDLFNSAHIANLKDIQTYILRRLDADQPLKTRFARLNKQTSIELLNLLLIKSNYSILYVEKCFDLMIVAADDPVTARSSLVNGGGAFLAPDDIKNIPAHLNGLYLFMLEKILADLNTRFSNEQVNEKIDLDLKELVYTLFSVGLLEFRPFARNSVFDKTKFRYPNLSRTHFDAIFDYISPILFTTKRFSSKKSQPNSPNSPAIYLYTLFHSSFVDWFTDVKFSTRKYFHSITHTHLLLAYYNYDKLSGLNRDRPLKPDVSKQKLVDLKRMRAYWSRFRFHFFKSSFNSDDGTNLVLPSDVANTLNYLYLLFDYDYEYKVCLSTLERKLLQCKKLLKLDTPAPVKPTNYGQRWSMAVDNANGNNKRDSSSLMMMMMRTSSSNVDYENSIYDLFRLTSASDSDMTSLRNELFDLVRRCDLTMLKHKLSVDYRLVELARRAAPEPLVDDLGQSLLLVAVQTKSGGEIVEYLCRLNPTLVEYCDSNAWTPLRYSAWIGKQNN